MTDPKRDSNAGNSFVNKKGNHPNQGKQDNQKYRSSSKNQQNRQQNSQQHQQQQQQQQHNPNQNNERENSQTKKRKMNSSQQSLNNSLNNSNSADRSIHSGGDDRHREEPTSSSQGDKNRSNQSQTPGGANFNRTPHPRLNGAPTWELPPQNNNAQQFTGRCRLFVANLPKNINEEMLRQLFLEYGQLSDIYIGPQNQFAFIKMDTRANAENARNALDGFTLDSKVLRVRLAAHAAAIKVTQLPPSCSNELLALAFSSFGPVERAIVVADDRGRSLNEGIVEFARKSSATAAIKKCQNECLLLTTHPIPVVVTSLESRDEDEGVPEKNLLFLPEYRKDREFGPRYAEPGSVEHTVARKWKDLYEIEAARREEFEAEMREMHESFKAKMEYFRLEESIKQLREQMMHMDSQSLKMMEIERERNENRNQLVHNLRQKSAEIIGPVVNSNDLHALRRQDTDLRQQADAFQGMLQRRENVYHDPQQVPGSQVPLIGHYDNGPGPQGHINQGAPPPMLGGPSAPPPAMMHHQMGPPQPLFGPGSGQQCPPGQQPPPGMHHGQYQHNGPPIGPIGPMGPIGHQGPHMGPPMGMGPGPDQWDNGPQHVPVFQTGAGPPMSGLSGGPVRNNRNSRRF